MVEKKVEKIEIEKLAHGGDGLGHLSDGRVVFVQGAVPGDVVDVELLTDKESWARGRVAELQTASDARTAGGCEAFDEGCGGCRFWNVDYDSELGWKVDAAREQMERISKVDLPDHRVAEAAAIRDYRNRVTYHQKRVGGEVIRGFYERSTHRIIEIDRCPIAEPIIDEAVAELGGALDALGTADVTVETAGDGEAVALIELGGGARIKNSQLEELARRVEQGTVVRGVEVLDEHDDYYVIGDTTVDAAEVLAHPPVEGMRVESGRFRQVNAGMNRRLVDDVVDLVRRYEQPPRVVEMFCGAGNFSFPVLDVAESLVGYEGDDGAVATARRIAELSGVEERVRFEVAQLENVDVVEQALEQPFELLILDPPRQGAAVVAEQMVRLGGDADIIYISCDAACLARDIGTLSEGGWQVEELTFYDMFPRSEHLEVVAVLSKA